MDEPGAMADNLDTAAAAVSDLSARLVQWAETSVFTVENAIGLGVLAVAVVLAVYARRAATPRLAAALAASGLPAWTRSRLDRLTLLVAPAVGLAAVWLAQVALAGLDLSPGILSVAVRLLVAWLLIRTLTALTSETALTRILGGMIWLVAALAILGWLGPLTEAMDAIAFSAGEVRVSALAIVNGAILVAVLLWLAMAVSGLAEAQLGRVEGVTPAARVLVGKVMRIAFIGIAVLVGLSSVGIDFTAVAVFSGAIGVGIGFGLQKVVSNLISGIILLLDRSIKPGDVIEIGEAYGWISKLGARYAAIVTRDGKEYLIPNEDLITQQVVNWSFSNRAVRLKVGVGVSYQSDVRKALDLMMQAATEHPRVLASPPPATRLIGFGDSSVDLELRVWIEDPEGGVVNVASDVRLRIWDLFHENGIAFPFPQRDIHIVSAQGLEDMGGRVPDAGADR